MNNYLSMKILVLGDSSAGKTSFSKRLCYNKFEEVTNQTVGCDYCVKTIDNLINQVVKLELWEYAGASSQ